jgi:hypothetical protein
MIAIRQEIREIESGAQPREDNLLKNAPHTAESLLTADWTHPYPRERAAYPLPWLRGRKFWPVVGRLNNVLGDRQFVCSCPPVEAYDPRGEPAGFAPCGDFGTTRHLPGPRAARAPSPAAHHRGRGREPSEGSHLKQ